jgi:hypothetical protein
MDQTPTQESNQSSMDQKAQRLLLFFGERLAIILFFLFTCALLISGNLVPQAFSEEEGPEFSRQDADWYNQQVKFPVPSISKTNNSFKITAIVVTPTPTPTPTPKIEPQTNADVWERLAQCETHANWSADTGNGYFGGLQFNQSAWESTGGSGNPAAASKDEQIMRGKILQERRGWGPWGGCSKKLGLL